MIVKKRKPPENNFWVMGEKPSGPIQVGRDLFLHLKSVRVIKIPPLKPGQSRTCLVYSFKNIPRFHADWWRARAPVLPGFQGFIKQQVSHRKGSEGASRPVDLKLECALESPAGFLTQIPGPNSQSFWFRGRSGPHLGFAWLSEVGQREMEEDTS